MRTGLRGVDKHNLYHEMLERLSVPQCPVCNLLEGAVNSFIDSLLYDKINDHRTRDALAKSKGFCHQHSRRLREFGNPLAHAILYSFYLRKTLQETEVLEEESRGKNPSLLGARFLRRRLKGEAPCPLCLYQKEAEERYLSSLVDFLQDRDFAASYLESVGVCRPHLLGLCSRFCPRESKKIAIRRFLQTAKELLAELEEIKRKTDYRFAREKVGAERDAWVRAVKFWTGGI